MMPPVFPWCLPQGSGLPLHTNKWDLIRSYRTRKDFCRRTSYTFAMQRSHQIPRGAIAPESCCFTAHSVLQESPMKAAAPGFTRQLARPQPAATWHRLRLLTGCDGLSLDPPGQDGSPKPLTEPPAAELPHGTMQQARMATGTGAGSRAGAGGSSEAFYPDIYFHQGQALLLIREASAWMGPRSAL